MPTPLQLGYRMPAEWEPHEATWIAWPHHAADWPGKFPPIHWVYVEIVRHLHQTERVHILAANGQASADIRRRLLRAGIHSPRVESHIVRTDRSWMRDSGPIFVVRDSRRGRETALTHWHFNAWAKYDNWRADAEIPTHVGRLIDRPVFSVKRRDRGGSRHVVLEGGSIDVNGCGTLLTTEECLLSDVQTRNPGFTGADYERLFADYLGVRKVLWLGRGIAGDDTHGHVDDLARFVDPRTIVTVVEDDPGDENYEPLRENRERLQVMTDQDGRPLRIVELPMPAPLWFDGRRLPASYANFYIANERVLVPTFNDPNDRRALAILADLFPKRVVVGIHAVDLVWGLGTLHCLTQQQPSA